MYRRRKTIISAVFPVVSFFSVVKFLHIHKKQTYNSLHTKTTTKKLSKNRRADVRRLCKYVYVC